MKDHMMNLGVLFMVALVALLSPALAGNAAAQDMSRLLRAADAQVPEDCGEYKVTVHTGNAEGAGTDANVYLTITGSNGDTGELALNSSTSPKARPSLDRASRQESRCAKDGYAFKLVKPYNSNDFNANFFERKSDTPFTVYGHDVGEIKSITVRTDNAGAGPAWLLSNIVVGFQEKSLEFPVNQWLEGNSLKTYTPTALDDLTDYTVTIKTGDVTGAGTDANISLEMEGVAPKGTVTIDKFILNGVMTGNVFERNQIDTAVLRRRPLIDNMAKITVSSDDSYSGSAWYLEWIVITYKNRYRETLTKTFQCHRWFEKGSLSAVFVPELPH
ncbi:MAG TPA: PLAT/LH2 domain-containing protein [Pyrinomonadaceae bacterium]|jgi:hypothetical protein|nr:PLAT/LH2 domain-containing protein [Pyrinomonadaceae bacterium]